MTAHDWKIPCRPLGDLGIVPFRGVFEVADRILMASDNLVEMIAVELLARKLGQPFAFDLQLFVLCAGVHLLS